MDWARRLLDASGNGTLRDPEMLSRVAAAQSTSDLIQIEEEMGAPIPLSMLSERN